MTAERSGEDPGPPPVLSRAGGASSPPPSSFALFSPNTKPGDGKDIKGVGIVKSQSKDSVAPEKPLTRWQRWMKKLNQMHDSFWYNTPMLFATLWTLTANFIEYGILPRSVDLPFEIVNAVIFFLFTMDLFISSLCKPKYLFRLYFWLDILAILSLLTYAPLLTGGRFQSDLGFAKAGKAARAGSRAGRLVRAFKLIKLFRERKKHLAGTLAKRENSTDSFNVEIVQTSEEIDAIRAQEEQTSLGGLLSDAVVQKVIVVVIALIILIPLADISPNLDRIDSTLTLLEGTAQLAADPSMLINTTVHATAMPAVQSMLDSEYARQLSLFLDTFPEVLFLRVNGIYERRNDERFVKLRAAEFVTFNTSNNLSFVALDVQKEVRLGSWLQLVVIFSVIIILGVSSAWVTNDAIKVFIGYNKDARQKDAERRKLVEENEMRKSRSRLALASANSALSLAGSKAGSDSDPYRGRDHDRERARRRHHHRRKDERSVSPERRSGSPRSAEELLDLDGSSWRSGGSGRYSPYGGDSGYDDGYGSSRNNPERSPRSYSGSFQDEEEAYRSDRSRS